MKCILAVLIFASLAWPQTMTDVGARAAKLTDEAVNLQDRLDKAEAEFRAKIELDTAELSRASANLAAETESLRQYAACLRHRSFVRRIANRFGIARCRIH